MAAWLRGIGPASLDKSGKKYSSEGRKKKERKKERKRVKEGWAPPI
jgi:hypothetical protein